MVDSPLVDALSPWRCRGECFWLFGHARAEEHLAPVAFNVLEGVSTFASPEVSGAYQGGLTSIMIARYNDSPVGPHDELIWVPGQFAVPPTGRNANRITRAYVSTKESAYNRRKHWNIPARTAHFTFVPSGANSPKALPYSRICVAPPDAPDNPFFVTDLAPSFLLSSGLIPFSSSFVPLSREVECPPLPQSDSWREDACIGTERWVSLTPAMKGKAGFFRWKGGLADGALADNVGLPNVRPWSTGMWLREFELEFPVGDVLGKRGG
ncbi:uncharacterized protein PHACADRAFT_149215 [Phanerochaete carnosa HHB-10118-sp]|uniref:Uncharacterized protein n=1 Tax=Phanerochaete carnosa (strain HHB-10118-sp) TaxID=650164 RepID=K5VM41_PHACS|nr:uncharacterized protein PHACADRAFT_149215 [Phanerochaete carnosa HHB-10118-sp]EKM52508.1 hypothetical protein PHACADRAFT_149215 [Phanerochaete carnosa HHB-10118-sp]